METTTTTSTSTSSTSSTSTSTSTTTTAPHEVASKGKVTDATISFGKIVRK